MSLLRLLELRRFVPRRKGWRYFPSYLRWRLETMGRRPTLRETWDYLGWCRDMNKRRRLGK